MPRDVTPEKGRVRAERELLKGLKGARATFDPDPLQGAIYALDAVFCFLDSRGVISDLAPLTTLRTALGDLKRGVVHPLLEPKVRTKGVPLTIWMQRAIAAGSVEALRATGLKSEEATEQVVKRLEALGIQVLTQTGHGRAVTKRGAVLSWRKDLRARKQRAPAEAREMYRTASKVLLDITAPETVDDARRQILALMEEQLRHIAATTKTVEMGGLTSTR
jgi:biotin operon repressor